MNPWLILLIGVVVGLALNWLVDRSFFSRKERENEYWMGRLQAELRSSDEEIANTKERIAELQIARDDLAAAAAFAAVEETVEEETLEALAAEAGLMAQEMPEAEEAAGVIAEAVEPAPEVEKAGTEGVGAPGATAAAVASAAALGAAAVALGDEEEGEEEVGVAAGAAEPALEAEAAGAEGVGALGVAAGAVALGAGALALGDEEEGEGEEAIEETELAVAAEETTLAEPGEPDFKAAVAVGAPALAAAILGKDAKEEEEAAVKVPAVEEAEEEAVDEQEARRIEVTELAERRLKQSKVNKIKGIGPATVNKLADVGIVTLYDFLDAAKTPNSRKHLAAQTRIAPKNILTWANRADLFRVRGVGNLYGDLLESTGVDTVPELAQRNPQNLHEALKHTNQEKMIVRKLPTPKQIEGWVEEANLLPRMIEY